MAARRAGQQHRNEARVARRSLLRELWKQLLKGLIVYVAVGAAVAAWLRWTLSSRWAFFAAGVWLGFGIGAWLYLRQIADGQGGRLINGADGETFTADELRRLRRRGWRCVHNVYFEAGDVDHVVVGPGGVVVVETKFSTADWPWLVQHGTPFAWARQASAGARRIAHLTRQHTKISVDPIPLVAVWGHARPDEPQTLGGITAMSGQELRSFIDGLPATLDANQIKTIHTSLESAAHDFDRARGVRHPGRIRGWFEW